MFFLFWIFSNIWAEKNYQFDYLFDQLTLEKKIEYCNSISPSEYIDGLTDGNFILPKFLGKTYFYRSRCFYQVAENTLDEKYCKLVVSRKTLLGDGSIMSPEVCLKNIQARIQDKLKRDKDSALFKEKTKDLVKLQNIDIKKISNENWNLEIAFAGKLYGEYQINIDNLNAEFRSNDKRIFSKKFFIKDQNHREKISITKSMRNSCAKCSEKLVTPIGISLELIKTDQELGLVFPIYSNVLNGYLD